MKKIITLLSLGTILLGTSAFIMNSGGIIGQTGAPGEGTCASCHSGGGGTTTVSITANPAFSQNQYVPGQTYTITIDVANSSFTKFGFNAEILNASNANSGTMTVAGAGVQFANSGAKKNATHTGISSTGIWSFEWVAPASGSAIIYVAGNAVNGTGNTGGDKPGNTSLSLTALGTDISKETITGAQLSLFPNPSANEFTLQYQLVKEGEIKIDLYNLNGQLVSAIANEQQSLGIHTVNANIPSDLAAGVYIVKLSVNGVMAAEKMFVKR